MGNGPEFDELYVISDLHLGGAKGFQIFGSTNELTAFIKWVRDRPASEVCLVINGDTVDFLAERGAKYFDPVGANDKLDRIFSDDTFKPILTALKDFVLKERRYLVFTLGNHDIELALPWVRDHFLEMLAGSNAAARGRITFSFDGTGYICSVAGSSVLCVHGNEVDTWNVTDFERLRRAGRDFLQGRLLEEWTPNAGTKLVIDVMNSVKQNHPFVDLLKPEVEAVVPVVLAMDPKQIEKLSRLLAVGTRLGWDQIRRMTGFLSAGEEAEEGPVAITPSVEDTVPSPAPLERLLAETFSRPDRSASASQSDELMMRVENRFKGGAAPLDLLAPGKQNETLGGFSAAWDWITGKPRAEVLREALEKLQNDPSFDVRNPDSPYRRLDELMGTSFDYLISGHTHQERRLARSRGPGTYFNSGTWVALMHFTPQQLSSEKEFAAVYKKLEEAKSIAELEQFPGLIQRKPAVVSITSEAGIAQARLQRVKLIPAGITLEEVQGV